MRIATKDPIPLPDELYILCLQCLDKDEWTNVLDTKASHSGQLLGWITVNGELEDMIERTPFSNLRFEIACVLAKHRNKVATGYLKQIEMSDLFKLASKKNTFKLGSIQDRIETIESLNISVIERLQSLVRSSNSEQNAFLATYLLSQRGVNDETHGLSKKKLTHLFDSCISVHQERESFEREKFELNLAFLTNVIDSIAKVDGSVFEKLKNMLLEENIGLTYKLFAASLLIQKNKEREDTFIKEHFESRAAMFEKDQLIMWTWARENKRDEVYVLFQSIVMALKYNIEVSNAIFLLTYIFILPPSCNNTEYNEIFQLIEFAHTRPYVDKESLYEMLNLPFLLKIDDDLSKREFSDKRSRCTKMLCQYFPIQTKVSMIDLLFKLNQTISPKQLDYLKQIIGMGSGEFELQQKALELYLKYHKEIDIIATIFEDQTLSVFDKRPAEKRGENTTQENNIKYYAIQTLLEEICGTYVAISYLKNIISKPNIDDALKKVAVAQWVKIGKLEELKTDSSTTTLSETLQVYLHISEMTKKIEQTMPRDVKKTEKEEPNPLSSDYVQLKTGLHEMRSNEVSVNKKLDILQEIERMSLRLHPGSLNKKHPGG